METLEVRGYTYRTIGKLQEALEDVNASFNLLQWLQEEKQIEHSALILNIIMGRGNVALDVGDYESGIKEFETATTLGRKMVEERKLKDISQLASSLMNLGKAYTLNKQYDIAFPCYTEAVEICRNLDQNGQLLYTDFFASALQHCGEGRCAAGDISGGLVDLNAAINKRRKLYKEGMLPKFNALIETLFARMKVYKSLGIMREAVQDGEEILYYIDQIEQTGKWINEKLVNDIKREMDALS